MHRIELAGVNGMLVLSSDEAGWCQIVLHQRDDNLPLGADVLDLIAAKLIGILDQRTSGTKWVLSLSELHTSIYGERAEGKLLLKVENADGKMIATLEVAPEQQEVWRAALADPKGVKADP